MLVEELGVTLADLLPAKGVVIDIPGQSVPFRVSERLERGIKQAASQRGVTVTRVWVDLINEINAKS